MEVHIDGLSKRFVSHWVFRKLSTVIPTQTHVAITGPNGSGKSTLLKIIAGALHPSEGEMRYLRDGNSIAPDQLYRHIAFAAPYVEMIEEMTLPEAVHFHLQFRAFHPEVTRYNDFFKALQFAFSPDRQLQVMSSGMKQRLRLAFAFCTESSLLLLDEPTSNLDAAGIQWFHAMLDRFGLNKTVVIASNATEDLRTCTQQIDLSQV